MPLNIDAETQVEHPDVTALKEKVVRRWSRTCNR